MRLLKNLFLGINGRSHPSYSIPISDELMRDGEIPRHVAPSRNNALVFAKNFISHPKMLGSAIPSSSFLINRLLRRVDWPNARTIVEYGPGTGCFTTEILNRLPKDGTLIAIDMNREFIQHLHKTIRDPRLHAFEGSAADVACFLERAGLSNADYVISGIPFSTIPLEIRRGILESTAKVLTPEGRMLVYQFSKKVLPHLEESFKRVETDFEPLNILPARLFYCEK